MARDVVKPLSLVGMTFGARKRAALWAVFVPHCLKELGYDPPTEERRHMFPCLKYSRELRAAYLAERLNYCPGQRLRPCIGCSRNPELWCPDTCCDGSGVTPARKAGLHAR